MTNIVADAPERALLRNVKNYNSLQGCDMCTASTVESKVESKQQDGRGKFKRSWPFSTATTGLLRTHEWHLGIVEEFDDLHPSDRYGIFLRSISGSESLSISFFKVRCAWALASPGPSRLWHHLWDATRIHAQCLLGHGQGSGGDDLLDNRRI